jgi:hypothetical protein
VSRLGEHAKKDARERIEELRSKSELTDAQQSAFEKLLSGTKLEGTLEKEASAALDALRAKNDGHPTDEEIAAVRSNKGKVGVGMLLGPALGAIAGDSANVDYTHKMVDKGMTADHLKNIDTILKDGQQVPMRIAGKENGGHFMMVSDVRDGDDGGRMYLVSDPWSGATRWVPEADFQSGAFTTKQFELGQAKVTTFFVDAKQEV